MLTEIHVRLGHQFKQFHVKSVHIQNDTCIFKYIPYSQATEMNAAVVIVNVVDNVNRISNNSELILFIYELYSQRTTLCVDIVSKQKLVFTVTRH